MFSALQMCHFMNYPFKDGPLSNDNLGLILDSIYSMKVK